MKAESITPPPQENKNKTNKNTKNKPTLVPGLSALATAASDARASGRSLGGIMSTTPLAPPSAITIS